MKKILLLVCFPLLLPLAAQADVSVDINVPGVSLHLGAGPSRLLLGWLRLASTAVVACARGRGLGERNARGLYWDGGRWQPSPPRGYEHREPERSGNPFHGDRDNRDRRHDDRGDHDRRDDGRGQPYPPGNAGPHR